MRNPKRLGENPPVSLHSKSSSVTSISVLQRKSDNGTCRYEIISSRLANMEIEVCLEKNVEFFFGFDDSVRLVDNTGVSTPCMLEIITK